LGLGEALDVRHEGRAAFPSHLVVAALTLLLPTYLAYEKQLRNLQVQEMRLRPQREKDTAELRPAPAGAHPQRKEKRSDRRRPVYDPKRDHTPFDPAEYEFDFSVDDNEPYFKARKPIEGHWTVCENRLRLHTRHACSDFIRLQLFSHVDTVSAHAYACLNHLIYAYYSCWSPLRIEICPIENCK
jgi:hypothetical protein